MIVLLILWSSSLLLFGSGLVAAIVARRKGYRPWFWLLSFGPIGALLMLFKPSLRQATTPEAREEWERRADWTGGVLSGFTLFFMCLLPAIGILTYFSMAIGPTMPRPPLRPIATTVINGNEISSMPAADIEGILVRVLQWNPAAGKHSIEPFIDGDRRGTRYTTSWSDGSGVSQGECVVEIADSQLWVNGKSYGSVAKDDSVDIDLDSVKVNGATRTFNNDPPESK